MTLQFEIDHVNEKNRSVQDLPERNEPYFSRHEPDMEEIINAGSGFEYDNLVVIGNGGSITSFRALYYTFIDEVDVNVRIVNTVDPDYLNRVKKEFRPEDTLVLAVSKSGETATVIESVLHFLEKGYEVAALTSEDSCLAEIAERKDLETFSHPEVGGRFSGLTETALIPASMAGLDVSEIRRGGEEMYEKLSPENLYNPALNFASALYDAERKGYDQVFTGFYSTRMFGFYPLLVQLMHETVCKEGEGQTVFGDIGPEFQHHTNQRIFGGKDNIVPLIFRTETHEHSRIEVPEELESVELKDRDLGDLDGMELQESLESEYRGFKDTLDDESIPNMTVNLTELSYNAAGELMAFLQYVAVYSAWLRGVEAFNQPDVEKSKLRGFESRFNTSI